MAGPLVVVLAKPPLRGRCKSRLAADVGAGPATRLARAMLADAWQGAVAAAEALGGEAVLATAGTADEYPLVLPEPVVVPQADGDLGRRMATLLARGLARHEHVLLLGTDSPGLPAGHVRSALASLRHHDLVLGPVDDGGYWCLGARAGPAVLSDPSWLDGLRWTSGATRAQTAARAAGRGLTVAEAPPWIDVDTGPDLPVLLRRLDRGADAAPATRAALDAIELEDPVSLVVASLDEGDGLARCLDALAEQPGPIEIVVADGGSRDASSHRAAARPGVTVVGTRPGRGRQLAAGAAAATGDVLLFLHVDVRLPPRATRLVLDVLSSGGPEAGAFVTRTEPDPSLPNRAGPLLRLADVRSRITRHPYGDQALFVTREAYDEVGGFRDLPILEDYDLARRLAARRPLARVLQPVSVSGRRMQTRPLRSLVVNRILPPLFRLGVDPHRLARLYTGGDRASPAGVRRG